MEQKGEATDNERRPPSSQIEAIFDSQAAVESIFSDPEKVPIVRIGISDQTFQVASRSSSTSGTSGFLSSHHQNDEDAVNQRSARV
jgi:hypothetical protein